MEDHLQEVGLLPAAPVLLDFRMVVVDKPIHIQPGELRCPRCFGKDIVPSLPRGWRDAVMSSLGKIPRHCRFCAKRFYASSAIELPDPSGQ